MKSLLYPRLPRPIADQLIGERMGRPVAELAATAMSAFPGVVYGATGTLRAGESHLVDIRKKVVTTATRHGYPDPASADAVVAFDRALAADLFNSLQIVPAEAAVPAVWDFTSLILLPDVVAWRFPGTNRERWICTDQTRHTIGRVWWQAFHLSLPNDAGPDLSLLDALSESDLNHIFERRKLAQNARVTQTVVRELLAARQRRPDLPARALLRDVAPRLLRLRWFVALDTLDDGQLTTLFRDFYAATEAALEVGYIDEDASPTPEVSPKARATRGDGLARYEAHNGRNLSDPRTCEWDDLVRSIVAVVDTEGPVRAMRVFRIIAASAGARLTNGLLDDFVKATRKAAAGKHIVAEGQHGADGYRNATLRLPSQPPAFPRELGPRDVADVPPTETRELIRKLRQEDPLLTDDGVARSLGDIWGLDRISGRVRDAILEASE